MLSTDIQWFGLLIYLQVMGCWHRAGANIFLIKGYEGEEVSIGLREKKSREICHTIASPNFGERKWSFKDL